MDTVSQFAKSEVTAGAKARLIGLFVVWIVATSAVLFWAGGRDIRIFAAQNADMEVYFELGDFSTHMSELIAAQANEKRITLVHFWNPQCRCDRLNQRHIVSLLNRYASDIDFFVVSHKANQSWFENHWPHEQHQQTARFIAYESLPLQQRIPASPAVAVLSGNNELLYIGPYATDGLCLPSENGIVEVLLERLRQGQVMKYPFMNGFGCFCEWPESVQESHNNNARGRQTNTERI